MTQKMKNGNTVITASETQTVSALVKLGFDVLTVEESPRLNKPLSTHTDMLVMPINGKFFLDRSQAALQNRLCGYGTECKIIDAEVSRGYPNDVPLNCAVIGKNLLCNVKTVSAEILAVAKKSGLNIINVSQGYTKCSTCVVTENAVITDDSSIHTACISNGIDSLQISKGSIALDGYNYGFIGGCSGLIDKGLIAFCGDLKKHSDFDAIKSFLDKYNVKYISLFDGQLKDIGGIIAVD